MNTMCGADGPPGGATATEEEEEEEDEGVDHCRGGEGGEDLLLKVETASTTSATEERATRTRR